MKRLIVYAIEIILCYLFQSAMHNYISLADIMPNMLLILVVSTAHMRGRMSGLFIGLFCGLILDFTGGTFIIGLYGLIYMLIGYVTGYTNKYYSYEDYTLPIIIIAISDFVYGFMFYIFEYLLRGRLNILFYLRRLVLPEIIYTAAASILLYKLLHMINNCLERNEDKEE